MTTATRHPFVDRFEEAWREPLTKFVELFHASGTLLQAGMDRPLRRDEIPAHQQRTMALLADYSLQVDGWAARENDVFIEWTAKGVFRGKPLSWSGASRFSLRDGLIVEEVAYFDTAPLRKVASAPLDGDLATAAMVASIGDPASVAGG